VNVTGGPAVTQMVELSDEGLLNVSDRGQFTAGITRTRGSSRIALSAGSTFTTSNVLMYDTSRLLVTEEAKLGANSIATLGSQQLLIAEGGQVRAGEAYIAGRSEVRIEGGRLEAGKVSLFDSQLLITGPEAALTIGDGGDFTLGGQNVAITLRDGGALNMPGTLTLASEVATLNIGGAVGHAPSAAAGTLLASAVSFQGQGSSINFNHNETGYVFSASMVSWQEGRGTINQLSGITNLTGDNSGFSGTTSVLGGTLLVNNALGGAILVGESGRLGGSGLIGSVANAGVIAPGYSVGTLTIAGDYAGNGGVLEIETELAGGLGTSDLLIVQGSTKGNTFVRITDRSGLVAAPDVGLKIVQVEGESNGTFTLLGDYEIGGEPVLVAGAQVYRLVRNDTVDPDDGDWYLRSKGGSEPSYQPGVTLYESYAGVLHALSGLDTLQQRTGNRSWLREAGNAEKAGDDGKGIWARIRGAHDKQAAHGSTSHASYSSNGWMLQAGAELVLFETEAGRLVCGVNVHGGSASARIRSHHGDGSIDVRGWGAGATLTWYGESGFYADGQAQFSWHKSDLHSSTLGRDLVTGNRSKGHALSFEIGQRFALKDGWSLTPQAQLAYASVDFDGFTDAFGALVSSGSGDRVIGRLGLAVGREVEWQDENGSGRSTFYGIANLFHDFSGGLKTNVGGTEFVRGGHTLHGGLGLGGSISWADGRFGVYGEANLNTDLEHFGDGNAVTGTVGLRVSW